MRIICRVRIEDVKKKYCPEDKDKMTDNKCNDKCKCKPNRSIECTVVQCANHCGYQDYCALDKIKVVTHEQNPTVVQCTDCGSFVLAKPER